MRLRLNYCLLCISIAAFPACRDSKPSRAGDTDGGPDAARAETDAGNPRSGSGGRGAGGATGTGGVSTGGSSGVATVPDAGDGDTAHPSLDGGGSDATTPVPDGGDHDAALSPDGGGGPNPQSLSTIFISDLSGPQGAKVYGYTEASTDGVPTQTFWSSRRIETAVDIAVDAAGYIYVSDRETDITKNAIQVFAPDSTGIPDPVRVITGPNTKLNYGIGMLYMAPDGRLFVASQSSIAIFAKGADGDVAPTSFMQGTSDPSGNFTSATPGSLGVDLQGGVVYWGGVSAIGVFPLGANGPTVPLRSFKGTTDPSGQIIEPLRLRVDGEGHVFDLEETRLFSFASNAALRDAPISTMASQVQSLPGGAGLTFDSKGRIFVASLGTGSDGVAHLSVYPKGTTGNAPVPVFTIPSQNDTFKAPSGVATTL